MSTAVLAQDSLTPLAMIVDASLGDGQPVAAMVRQLAEANMSKAARAARQEKQRAAEVSVLCIPLLQRDVQCHTPRCC
jgi:hypothetical protein